MKASDILLCDDLKTSVVEVKEWNCKLHIRELGLDEGIKLFSMAQNLDGNNPTISGDDIAQVIAWGVIDPDTNERLFTDKDVKKLAKKSSKPLMTLYKAITDLSGEDAEKN